MYLAFLKTEGYFEETTSFGNIKFKKEGVTNYISIIDDDEQRAVQMDLMKLLLFI